MTDKIDFKKTLAGYRAQPGRFEIVEIPDMRYLAVDGDGDPNTSRSYKDALEALYPVAYNLKFASKRELDRDYVVPPLEGLWWADDMGSFSTMRDKSLWRWTMLLMVPEWISEERFAAAVSKVASKGAPVRLADVELRSLSEGMCVQTLHIGPFDDEGPVLERMHREFMPEHGLQFAGKHHEIYFGDFRKVAPEKLRTILRQPVRRARSNG